MRSLIVLSVLLLITTAACAQQRGVLVKDIQPIDPGAFTAELASIQPVWSSGGDWSKVTVVVGIGYAIQQPEEPWARMLTPDRAVAFWGTQTSGDPDLKLGGELDWDIVDSRLAACVVAFGNVAVGVKLTAFSQEF